MKVFIADDSNLVVDRLTSILRNIQGIELIGRAADAPQAIQSIRELNPDAVILDVQMPGPSGITVLETIKAEKPWVKVLMLTNFAYAQYRVRCLRAGADFFLDKSEIEKIPQILLDLKEAALRTAEDIARMRSGDLGPGEAG